MTGNTECMLDSSEQSLTVYAVKSESVHKNTHNEMNCTFTSAKTRIRLGINLASIQSDWSMLQKATIAH